MPILQRGPSIGYGFNYRPPPLIPSRGATHPNIRCLHVPEGRQSSGIYLRVIWSTFSEISGRGLGGCTPVSHRRRPGPVPAQSLWNSWWTNSAGTGFPPGTLISFVRFFLSVLRACSFICNRRCTWGVQVLKYPNFFLGNGSR